MKQIPHKPFKDFDEMVSVLRTEHGLTISLPDMARDTLRIIPYYDLINGYKECFMHDEKFSSDIDFSFLYLFYIFDHGFQNILFEFSNTVEDYFKNILAHVSAEDFSIFEDEYLDKKHYRTKSGPILADPLLGKIRSVYETSTPEEPTLHYKKCHNHIPPWILLKNVTFSNAINLFRLLKDPQRYKICDIMIPQNIEPDQKYQLLLYILTLVRKCRNSIAHGLKFISFSARRYCYHLNFTKIMSFVPHQLLRWSDLKRQQGLFDIYAYIVFSLSLIPNSILKGVLITRLVDYLSSDFPVSSPNPALRIDAVYLEKAKLPSDLFYRLSEYNEFILSEQINLMHKEIAHYQKTQSASNHP